MDTLTSSEQVRVIALAHAVNTTDTDKVNVIIDKARQYEHYIVYGKLEEKK